MFAQVGSEVQLDRSTNDSRLVSGLARLYDRIDRPPWCLRIPQLGRCGAKAQYRSRQEPSESSTSDRVSER